jgi:quinol monooxygenase YgiN
MAYVRVSIMQPKPGQEARARELIAQLVAYYEQQPGYVRGYRLDHLDSSGRLGRIGVWVSEQDANHAAQTPHDLALRSELNLVVAEGGHQEYSFEGTESLGAKFGG